MFDWSINVNTIVAIVALLLSMMAAYASLRDRLVALEVKVEPLWVHYRDKGE